ncbi:MAG: two-component regulator propeller domain-containing protein [Caldilineaceae bacterium]
MCFILFLFTLLPAPTAHAAGSGNWRTYTTADGLLSNNIQALAYREDPLDFPPCDRTTRTDCPAIPGLWLGTDQGLTYLNGRDNVAFNNPQFDKIPNPDIRDLLFDTDRHLWIATAGGLVMFDDNSTPIDKSDDRWSQTYLAGREVLALTQTADGRIWAGTDSGLVELDPQSQQEYTHLSTIRVTALPTCPLVLGNRCQITTDDHFWIGTNQGLYQLSLHDRQATPSLVNGLPFPTTPLTITALTITTDGLWVGSNQGAAHWDGQQWNVFFDGTGNLASPNVRAIDLDARGDIWFATARGAARWRPTYHTWQHFFAPSESLPSDDLRALLIEPQGAVWLGTDAGVSSTDGAWTLLDTATTYNYTSIVNSRVNTQVEDRQGRMWVGTDGGVSVFDSSLTLLKSFTHENGALTDNLC